MMIDVLKLLSSVISIISGDRPLHARGAATANARSPKAFVEDRSCMRRLCMARILECLDCRFWGDVFMTWCECDETRRWILHLLMMCLRSRSAALRTIFTTNIAMASGAMKIDDKIFKRNIWANFFIDIIIDLRSKMKHLLTSLAFNSHSVNSLNYIEIITDLR